MTKASNVSRRGLLLAGSVLASALLLASAPRLRADAEVTFLDLTAQINQNLDKNFHSEDPPNNNLINLPQGEQTLEGVKFKVGSGVVQLGSTQVKDKPEKAEGIKVGQKAAVLHFFHGTGYGGGPSDSQYHVDDGTLIGGYEVHYSDNTSETIKIVYGEDVRDWWLGPGGKEEIKNGKIAWKGENDASKQNQCALRLYSLDWKNPHPDKQIESLTFKSELTKCAPFPIAVSVEK